MNGKLVASSYGYSTGTYADSGNSAMLHLTTGDRVYIKAHDDYDNALYGAPDQIYTTFTGVLLDSGSYGTLVSITLLINCMIFSFKGTRNGFFIKKKIIQTNLV